MSATTGAVVGSMVAIQPAQNERIEKQRCQMVLENYDPVYAETKGMKDYAYCVEKLYPSPMTHNETMLAKGCIIVLLISLVVGVIIGYKKSKEPFGDWADILLWSFMVPACAFITGVVLILIVTGIGFLFS